MASARIRSIMVPPRNNQVWLFLLRSRIVGYGTLGTTRRPIPAPSGPFTRCSIIPFFGLQLHYRGRPRWALRDERFAGQIMGHIIQEARQAGHPLLILYVHPNNAPARNFYRKFGFFATGALSEGHE